jgi:hypothetical protein
MAAARKRSCWRPLMFLIDTNVISEARNCIDSVHGDNGW